MKFGEKVRALREEKGMTQKDLAEALQVSTRTVVSYERGQSYPKQRRVYDRLASLFNVETNYLYMEDEAAGQAGASAEMLLQGTDREAAERLVQQAGVLFAGGRLSEEDKDAVMRALQDAYWQARQEKAQEERHAH